MFQVIWRQEAVNDLAEIWNYGDSALRRAITQAAQSIDQALQEDPSNFGESREAGVRVMFAPPLGVRFRVDQDNQMAVVGHIWLIPPPRRRA